MLKNLNENICVSRYKSQDRDMWICFEISKKLTNSKRQTWKPLTGLLSKSEMHRYLEHNFKSGDLSNKYESISLRS